MFGRLITDTVANGHLASAKRSAASGAHFFEVMLGARLKVVLDHLCATSVMVKVKVRSKVMMS